MDPNVGEGGESCGYDVVRGLAEGRDRWKTECVLKRSLVVPFDSVELQAPICYAAGRLLCFEYVPWFNTRKSLLNERELPAIASGCARSMIRILSGTFEYGCL